MGAEPGWYDDPTDATQYRYWDGERWTEDACPRSDFAAAVIDDAVVGPADAAEAGASAGAATEAVAAGAPPWARAQETAEAVDPTAPVGEGFLAREVREVTFETDNPVPLESERTAPVSTTKVGGLITSQDRMADDLRGEEFDFRDLSAAKDIDIPLDASGRKVKKQKKVASKSKKDANSNLPLLLGILAVVLIGAGVYLLFFQGDNDLPEVAPPVETTEPAAEADDPATVDPGVAGAPATDPAVDPAAGDASTTPIPTVALDSPEGIALQQAFDAEVNRACEVIKADPGRFTEDVITFNPAWGAIGRNYESLQKAVNDCTYEARETALKLVEEAERRRLESGQG